MTWCVYVCVCVVWCMHTYVVHVCVYMHSHQVCRYATFDLLEGTFLQVELKTEVEQFLGFFP